MFIFSIIIPRPPKKIRKIEIARALGFKGNPAKEAAKILAKKTGEMLLPFVVGVWEWGEQNKKPSVGMPISYVDCLEIMENYHGETTHQQLSTDAIRCVMDHQENRTGGFCRSLSFLDDIIWLMSQHG